MPKPELQHKVMPFGEHLEELRRRVVLALMGIVPLFIGALFIGRTLLGIIIEPVISALAAANLPESMIQTSPLESFYSYFRIALVVTVAVGSPWIVYQLWLFVAPGLYQSEKRFAHLLAPMSVLLTVLGCLFMYFVLLPVMLHFFVNFSAGIAERAVKTAPLPPGVVLPVAPVLDADPPDPRPGEWWFNTSTHQFRIAVPERSGPDHGVVVMGVSALSGSVIAQQYRLAEWVSLFLQLMLAMSLAFQTPVVVLLLGWAGLVTPDLLAKYRKHAVFVCVIFGALVTPGGDPVSMALLTIPLFLLFEFGSLLLRWFPARRIAGRDELSDDFNGADGDQSGTDANPDDTPIIRDDEGDAPGAADEGRTP